MDNIIVYYHVFESDGGLYMALTEKTYWDVAHKMDEGVAPHYEEIAIAMGRCGQVEVGECYYELESPEEEQQLVEGMRAYGFELQTDDEFSAYMDDESASQ